MSNAVLKDKRLGWVGTGRMGYALASRLLEAGCDLAVYNRTRAKAEPLAEAGATIVDSPADLADRDIVFTMVAGPSDFEQVMCGPEGLLSRDDSVPGIVVDSTTISPRGAAGVRARAAERGTQVLAAPVSGNPKVVEAGRLTIVVSGPADAYEQASAYIDVLGAGVTYVGEGERARLVKICHNIMLGVVSQSLAEITVLAEKGGISRADFLEFLNDSVMGSVFTRYKTPAVVNLDYTPTFTPALLLKDFDLGFEAAREHHVPMPVAAAAAEIVSGMLAGEYADQDFMALLDLEAKAAGLDLQPEQAAVSDGLDGRADGRVAPAPAAG
ncbi:MAG: NAD(P)-dependent oxidoreductase [Thermoleophilaceae bacterium]